MGPSMASPHPTPPDLTPGGLDCSKPQLALHLHDFLEGGRSGYLQVSVTGECACERERSRQRAGSQEGAQREVLEGEKFLMFYLE